VGAGDYDLFDFLGCNNRQEEKAGEGGIHDAPWITYKGFYTACCQAQHICLQGSVLNQLSTAL